MGKGTREIRRPAERALLVGIGHARESPGKRHLLTPEDSLQELARLAETAGATVVGSVQQVVHRIHPATYIGSGKSQEVARVVQAASADIVIFDEALSPAQHRNLERVLGVRVLDRSQLILDIFATRARSQAGKLQVELAQLQYLLPRLTRQWTHLSRLGGGVGTRGPGETQLEVDRRRVRERIAALKRRLAEVERTRGLQRRRRLDVPLVCVALVGYTNCGKSSLMNRLTQAGVLVEDKLFATLDPTVRGLRLPDGRSALLIDTVGFIHRLPHELIDAFKSTLDEVSEADLLLHVIDASSERAPEQVEVVDRVLGEIGAGHTPCVRVWNKIDLLKQCDLPLDRVPSSQRVVGEVRVSALSGEGIDRLLARLSQALGEVASEEYLSVELPAGQQETLAWLYRRATVIEHNYDDGVLRIKARMSSKVAGQLRKRLAGSDAEHA